MYLSLNNPTSRHDQMKDGWQRLELKFEDIPLTVRQLELGGYCSNKLVDGSREKNKDESKPTGIERYAGDESILILDIDNHITIPMAKDVFSKYKTIIVTTKRHKSDHHRFRVFIKLNRDINDYHERLKFMEYIYKAYPFLDQSCKNCNRLFYTSPINAEVYSFLDGIDLDIDEIIDDNKHQIGQIQLNSTHPIPEHTQTHKDAVFVFCELQEKWKNEYGEVLENNETDDESKLRGVQTFLDREYYQGQKSNTLFKTSSMMKKDGFSDDFITDYLIRFWQDNSCSTDRMSSAMQNIRGGLRT